jgi:hypothetical protein
MKSGKNDANLDVGKRASFRASECTLTREAGQRLTLLGAESHF